MLGIKSDLEPFINAMLEAEAYQNYLNREASEEMVRRLTCSPGINKIYCKNPDPGSNAWIVNKFMGE